MDIVNCKVRHRGDMHHTISRYEIDVVEVMVLRHIHGEDAVVEIQVVGHTRKPGKQVIDRIDQLYGAKIVEEVFGKNLQQAAASLPKTLADIQITPDSPLICVQQREVSKDEAPQISAAENYGDDDDVEQSGDQSGGNPNPAHKPRETITLKKGGQSSEEAKA